jgi:4-oxalocrotonate tautomerase
MPTVLLRVAPLQNPERYAVLAHALTELTARVLHKRREVTAVVIDDLPAAHWHVGGEPLHQHASQAAAWLQIDITAGTNTVDEKARFVAEAWAVLRHHLAQGQPLAEASYVTVRELPATDWGYGGQTQAQRRVSGTVAPAALALPVA